MVETTDKYVFHYDRCGKAYQESCNTLVGALEVAWGIHEAGAGSGKQITRGNNVICSEQQFLEFYYEYVDIYDKCINEDYEKCLHFLQKHAKKLEGDV